MSKSTLCHTDGSNHVHCRFDSTSIAILVDWVHSFGGIAISLLQFVMVLMVTLHGLPSMGMIVTPRMSICQGFADIFFGENHFSLGGTGWHPTPRPIHTLQYLNPKP
jgi:hypothetical protein